MKYLFLLLSCYISLQSFAYPIDPCPLRVLVAESACIIVGHVQKIEVTEAQSGDEIIWEDSRAVILVKEVLQGKLHTKVIKVPFMPGMVCPAPPYYEAGTTVLAFLDKKEGVYYTHALSYGAKTLQPAEIVVYKQRIREIQAIQRLTDSGEKFRQTVEWLVKCAENKATRWEGTYELSPGSDFMSYYKTSEPVQFGQSLSREHKVRLKNALFSEGQCDYVDFGLVDLIQAEYTAEVDGLLRRNLEALSVEGLWFAGSYMERLVHRTDNPRAQEIMDTYSKRFFEDYGDVSPEKVLELRRFITEFIRLVE